MPSKDKPSPLDKVKVIVDKMEVHHAIEMWQALGEYLHLKLMKQREEINSHLSKLPNGNSSK